MIITQNYLYFFLSFLVILPYVYTDCTTSTNACDPAYNCQACSDQDNTLCCSCSSTGTLSLQPMSIANKGSTCASGCPSKYYDDSFVCKPCNSLCKQCDGPSDTQCDSCEIDAYLLGTTCYSGLPYSNNPCPPLYYGIYSSSSCQACPTGCTQCNIFLQHQMPSPFSSTNYRWDTQCDDSGGLCIYALKCYSCQASYELVQGHCLLKTTYKNCYKYSVSNVAQDQCLCKDGFYLEADDQNCNLCHWSCKTCSGSSSSQCQTCHIGATLDGAPPNSCLANSSYAYLMKDDNLPSSSQLTPTMTSGSGSAWASSDTNCLSSDYLFGYYGYSNGVSNFGKANVRFFSTNSLIQNSHYAIHLKAKLLFIDSWKNGQKVIFKQNNQVINYYKYQMENIPGEYLCGRAQYDHFAYVEIVIQHARIDNLTIDITVQEVGYSWGIQDIVIGVLNCHSECQTCSGPESTDCLTCQLNHVLVDDECMCDIDNDYYHKSGTCVQDCSPDYKNPQSRTCTAGCPSIPFQYYKDQVNKICVQNCPVNTWKLELDFSCVTNCYLNHNYYKLNSSNNKCVQICPNGTYGDPNSGECLEQCPVNWYSLGNVCVSSCSSPNQFEYPQTRSCLSACPIGFFQNNIGSRKICQYVCSVTRSGQLKYGQNTTKKCVDICPAGSGYADQILHLCVSNCNETSFKVIQPTTLGRCTLLCPTGTYGNQQSGDCVLPIFCPQKQFGDPLTTFCQQKCTHADYFGDNVTKECVTSCPTSTPFKQNATKRCVKTCPSPEFGDSTKNNYCVADCTDLTKAYADIQQNRQCVEICADSPISTFGLGNKCVDICDSDTWADVNKNRKCTTNCTYDIGVTETFAYNETRMCVQNCPDTYFGIFNDDLLSRCVKKCESTRLIFGNPDNNLCVDSCPSPYFADQTSRQCVYQCPANNFSQIMPNTNVRVCVIDCQVNFWADAQTRKCTSLPQECSNGLYAHQTNRKCVEPLLCDGYADPESKKCVVQCPANNTFSSFGQRSSKLCVTLCSIPLQFGDNHTHMCQTTCAHPDEVRDPQDKLCVEVCSNSPQILFFDSGSDFCVPLGYCTDNKYSDSSNFECSLQCQGSDKPFADPISKSCVKQCEMNWYGDRSSGTGICVEKCLIPQWADNKTVLCQTTCSTGTYGYNYTDVNNYGICLQQCPDGQWAQDGINICVKKCGSGLYGNNLTNKCVTAFSCPNGTYGDDLLNLCVFSMYCSNNAGIEYVADNTTNKCVPECPDFVENSNFYNWADMTKKLCVIVCPHGEYGFNTTKTCQSLCRDLSGSTWPDPPEYADKQLGVCVKVCSASPLSTFGNFLAPHQCVQAKDCNIDTWADNVESTRKCVEQCPTGKNADNITKNCVQVCPTYFFADTSLVKGMCVSQCPKTIDLKFQFSDNQTRKCTTTCSSTPILTFGDTTSLRCVRTCKQGQFAQQSQNLCKPICNPSSWANPVRRFCEVTPTACPVVNGTIYYADDIDTQCTNSCPSTFYGQNSTKKCVEVCGAGKGFKYDPTKVCIDLCPAGIDGDGYFADNGECVFECKTIDTYRDPQNARSCQSNCFPGSYKDPTTMKCVLECPSYPIDSYADETTGSCIDICTDPSQPIADPITRKCVAKCPDTTFYDKNSKSCVQQCPTDSGNNLQYFGDNSLLIPQCVKAEDCSPGLFADSHLGLCVNVCSDGQSVYQKLCVNICPHGYFRNTAGICVQPSDCEPNRYAENSTHTCVLVCQGTFADKATQQCVNICPEDFFADPITRQCSQTCTSPLVENQPTLTCISSCPEDFFLQPLNNTCLQQCPAPYYADRVTQTCVSVCPSFPPLFGDKTQRICLEQCNSIEFKSLFDRTCVEQCVPGEFRNNITRSCVTECDQGFADIDSKYCIADCRPKYAFDDLINKCVQQCPLPYYRDPTTFTCVTQCPTSPSQYFKATLGSDNYCSQDCPTGQFRDILSFSCVQRCPLSPPTYADNSTWNCVSVCPQNPDYYASNLNRDCVFKCPLGQFAQNDTRTCVKKCPSGTDLYADSTIDPPKCVHICSPGYYADPYTLKCTSACHKSPQTYGYEDKADMTATIRICVQKCPYGYAADNSTFKCVSSCPHTNLPYFDKATSSCVAQCTSQAFKYGYVDLSGSGGQCVAYCPSPTFSSPVNNKCVDRCPGGYYGETTNRTCNQNCSIANNKFADDFTNTCVDTCSVNSYGDRYSLKCVAQCPKDKFTVIDTNTKQCQQKCSQIDQFIDYTGMICLKICPNGYFADSVSGTCVSVCSLSTNTFGNSNTKVCVPPTQCQSGYYGNFQTRLCVLPTSCPIGYFGIDPQSLCVNICPLETNKFGDPITKKCQTICSPNYYSDPITRLCVLECPSVPQLYGKLPSRTCQYSCPNGEFADSASRKCVSSCEKLPSETQTFADNSTNTCVQKCPNVPNYFSQNVTFTCIYPCPSSPSMFADYSTRTCVLDCPKGNFPTFADPLSRQCVKICPGNTYMQNSTSSCVVACSEGFADPISHFCIDVCPAHSYGLSGVCLPSCPNGRFAQDATHLCQVQCKLIHNTFQDSTTNQCVKVCPIDLYAEETTRSCLPICNPSVPSFSDFSTRKCVLQCPSVPSLFGYLPDLKCLPVCPPGTYSNNQTRRCDPACPTTPDTYRDLSTNACVTKCPTMPIITWADDFTRNCVDRCPSTPDYYADNSTGRCGSFCTQGTYADPISRRCLQTCPTNSYGRNATWRCVPNCQIYEFADHLLNLCVAKCSVDPVFYGNPDTHSCIDECPSLTHSFGNPLTQQCVSYIGQLSGCPGLPNHPDNYYSDNSTRLCVKKCPQKQDTYGDNSTRKCVIQCPQTQNTFSDNSTMMCVTECPNYPDYYAEIQSRRCVSLCLQATPTFSGSFSDNSTRKCVQTCPSNPDYYSDNSTRRCVFHCPAQPLTFADYSTRKCVTTCPSTPDIYADLKTRRCVLDCPQDESTYADSTNRLCVKVCPTPYFGNNDTNRCVTFDFCPTGTYADEASRLCVALCPQYPDTYGDYSTKRCVQQCPSSPDLFADPFSQTCIDKCPTSSYAQNLTRRCLMQCPMDQVNYADNLTQKCVSLCPSSEKTYGDNSTQKCVLQCPDTPFTFADNMTRMCLTACNNETLGGFAQNISRICVEKCPDGSYGDILTRSCVRYCPNGWFAYSLTNLCVENCPSPFFADSSTWRCVLQCPVSQLIFGQNIDRTCTSLCPDGLFADSYTQECVANCPGATHGTYAFSTNRTCVQQCPIPLFGYPVNWTCLASCQNPYYENYTDHKCYLCPSPCFECNYPQMCISCIPNWYLYSGTCVQSCPTFPTITYANPNGICGTASQCTPGYFALNSTKSCVQSCPAGYYKNNTLQSCDSCLVGCQQCTNANQCQICNNAIALWDNSICHVYCSPIRRYYTTIGCVAVCPVGYYLKLVTCYSCSIICKSCSQNPNNCLTCANGFYLSNSLCVQQCPNGTKPVLQNQKLYCKLCNETNCTKTPLTYTITQYIQNYQYKFRLQFSQAVTLLQQVDKVIRIRQVTERRLLQQNTQTNFNGHFFTNQNRLLEEYSYIDYTIIDYGNGEYVFVLDGLDSRNQEDLKFYFQIFNTQAIVSASGEFPESTRSYLIIKSQDFYSQNDYNSSLADYCFFLAIFTVILLALTIFTNQSIWMPIIDIFHFFFSLLFINMTLPPTLAYCLSKSKIVALTFLPNMFVRAIPRAKFDSTITSTLFTFFGDMMFIRTMGYLYTVMLVYIVGLLVMLVLWKKHQNIDIQNYCKKYLTQTVWKRDIHGLIYLFFIPTFLIALLKMRNYTTETPIQTFSIFSSILFILPMIIAPVYFAYKIIAFTKYYPTTYSMLKKAYDYISTRNKVAQNNTIYHFEDEKNQIDLSNIWMPRMNHKLILPFPIETAFRGIRISMPFIQYLYKLLLCVIIIATYETPMIQLFTILSLTILALAYFIISKPYIQIPLKQYNNYLTIVNLSVFCIVIACMIILHMGGLDYQNKLLVGYIAAGFVAGIFTINFVYFCWRTYLWYHNNIWRFFILTDMFRDNYVVQYWDFKKEYEIIEKQDEKRIGGRQQFLHAIKLQNKLDGLENMVKIDPNDSRLGKLKSQKKPEYKNISLRPNRTRELKKQIDNVFNIFNEDKQRSVKSLKTSQRLSKKQRSKVRDIIFGQKDFKLEKDQFQKMKFNNQVQQSDSQSQSDQPTQYQYQYIDQVYPQGTDIQQILQKYKQDNIEFS